MRKGVPVPLDLIDDNPYQPRHRYDDAEIEALADNIEREGLLQLPLGRVVDEEGQLIERSHWDFLHSHARTVAETMQAEQLRVQLAFGHRRKRAHEVLAARDSEYDVVARGMMRVRRSEISDHQMDMLAWSENRDRKDLTPLEEARAIEGRIDRHDWTQAEAAEHLGIGRSTVANKLRLLKLPKAVRMHLQKGTFSERQARAFLSLNDMTDEQREKAAEWGEDSPHHPKEILRAAAEHDMASDAIRERVADAVATLDREVERERPPEGWRIMITIRDSSQCYVAERGDPGDDDYLITGPQNTRREAAEAAHSMKRKLTSEAAGNENASDLSASEAAAALRERHGIDDSISKLKQRGTEALRKALAEADAQAKKDSPAGETLKSEIEHVEEWAEGDYSGQSIAEVQKHLKRMKEILRGIDRREKWVREQIGEVETQLMKVRYQDEIFALSRLKHRTMAVQTKLKDEWLPQAQEGDTADTRPDSAPSGDAMPDEAHVEAGEYPESARIYEAFRVRLKKRLAEAPRWLLLSYLSRTGSDVSHHFQRGEELLDDMADRLIERQRYVKRKPGRTRMCLEDFAQGIELDIPTQPAASEDAVAA
jgi:ParB/RepB/Spo0J family partition protein